MSPFRNTHSDDEHMSSEDSLASIAMMLPSLEERMQGFPALIEDSVKPVRDAVALLEMQGIWFRRILRFLWRIVIAMLISFALDVGITTWLFVSSRNANRAVAQSQVALAQLQAVAQNRDQACAMYNSQIAATRSQVIATDTALLNLEQAKIATLADNEQKTVALLGAAQYQQLLLADQQVVTSLQNLVNGADAAFPAVNCNIPTPKG